MKRKLRKGVFFVVYSFEKGKPVYLLLKRKLHWVGWEFPKAGVERFETKKSAVKRETIEETGLAPLKIKKHRYSGIYIYPEIFPDRIGYLGQTFSLYSVEVEKGKVKIDKKEHSNFKWVKYKDAVKIMVHKNQIESLKIVNDWILKK
jgi:8-oxo-dGTP pyrophosphatase MutT (NUDIX family)